MKMKIKMSKSISIIITLLVMIFIISCNCEESQRMKIKSIEPESVLYKRHGGVAGHIYNLNGDRYLIVSEGAVQIRFSNLKITKLIKIIPFK